MPLRTSSVYTEYIHTILSTVYLHTQTQHTQHTHTPPGVPCRELCLSICWPSSSRAPCLRVQGLRCDYLASGTASWPTRPERESARARERESERERDSARARARQIASASEREREREREQASEERERERETERERDREREQGRERASERENQGIVLGEDKTKHKRTQKTRIWQCTEMTEGAVALHKPARAPPQRENQYCASNTSADKRQGYVEYGRRE